MTIQNKFWCLTAIVMCFIILYLFLANSPVLIRYSVLHTFQITGYTTGILDLNRSTVIKTTVSTHSSEIYVSGNTSKDWCSGLKNLYPLNLNFSNTRELKNHSPLNNVSIGYELDPKQICDRKSDIDILSIVKSKVNHFKLRQAVRESWGKRAANGSNALIFSLGISKDATVQNNVRREFSTYRDILQGNFIDNYYNNTIKTTMGIRWASSTCRNTHFVWLVDEDVMVNFQNLEYHVSKITEDKENYLFSGNLKNFGGPMRKENAKWFMSKYQFPYTCYPPYISGGAILTSGRVISRISEALPFVRRFRYDDVYLGIIVQKLGIRPQRNIHVSMRNLKDNELRTFITSHGYKKAKEYLATYRNFNT